MKIIERIKDNKQETVILFIITCFFAVLTYLFWGRQGHPVIDCGREAYIPSAILKGKVLFKDILSLYGPFSYQFNALLYKIFGENLNTLYAAGALNSYIILGSIYAIARNITGKTISFIVSMLIMTAFIFHCYISSYTFPYSYAITYALSGFLLSVLFCIRYIKTSQTNYIYLSFFFLGISLLSKIEFSIFIAILALTLIYKPISKKEWILSIISLISTPLLSFILLAIQGLTIADFSSYLNFMQKYSSSNLVIYFYKNYTGFFPSTEKFISNINIFITTFKGFLLASLVIYPTLAIISNKYLEKIKLKFNLISKLTISTISSIILVFLLPALNNNAQETSFSWIPISTTLILLGFIVYYSIKFQIYKRNPLKQFRELRLEISQTDKIFLMLLFIALFGTLKSYFFVNLRVFGTFVLPLAILVNIIFLVDYFPKMFKFLDKKLWKINCLIFFTIISGLFALRNIDFSLNKNTYPITTERGTLYTIKEFGEPMQQAIDYARSTPENSKILVIPEGLMVNFLANRPSDDWYYSLIPNYVETFSEETVVKDLSKNQPDYIFINNRDCSDYGFPIFGADFGYNILDFIRNNYTYEKSYGEYLQFKISKKN